MLDNKIVQLSQVICIQSRHIVHRPGAGLSFQAVAVAVVANA